MFARQQRRVLFNAAQAHLDNHLVQTRGADYPVLNGEFGGLPVQAEPLVDTLTIRKLPTLWLLVTMRARLQVNASLDLLLRPNGTEFFSPNNQFGVTSPPPAWLNTHARLATDGETDTSLLNQLAPLTNDPDLKELLIGRNGIRVVYRIADATQGPYRSMRKADFGAIVLDPVQFHTVLTTTLRTIFAHRLIPEGTASCSQNTLYSCSV